MGARTDFVRAMLFGIVIGVAITTAFFQLRKSEPAQPAPAQPAPAQPAPAQPAPASMPVPAHASASAPAPEPAAKQALVDALAKTGVAFDAARVTCTADCCRISVDDTTYDEHAEGIKSALAQAPGKSWQAYKAGTVRMLEKCW